MTGSPIENEDEELKKDMSVVAQTAFMIIFIVIATLGIIALMVL